MIRALMHATNVDQDKNMSRLSYRFSKALAAGRHLGGRPASREEVLAKLLVKRAAAYRAGLSDLEASLRRQITWSLPIHKGEIGAPHGETAVDRRL